MRQKVGIWSVSQLNNYIKEVLDTDPNLQKVMIKGEISNFHHHSSGHMYFTLKDKNSQLRAVMFKSYNQKLDFNLENGMAVVIEGNISLYKVRGEYQVYVNDVQPDGVGALHIAFEQLKKKLEKEGLFKEEWKRSIPQIPSQVGVVTSPTGAAICDIISVIKRRFSNVSLLIAPATVQGPSAEDSLARGLELLNQSNVDVIIIGRGGGSLEDLWAFNKERVARTIFNSKIPVISAVGHETDFTIADFVADLRAPTPSAAAELVISNQEELERYLKRLKDNLYQAMENKLIYLADRVEYLTERRSFKLFGEKIREYMQQIDDLSRRLERNFKGNLDQKKERLQTTVSQLNSLSPLNTLARGYSLVRKLEDKHEVNSISQVKEEELIEVILQDGQLTCQIKKVDAKSKK